ncbi:hypothetical protein Adt_44798 [Abeliophyllum distichum]|uniref:Uncharacterized protein n=1 Tax=Abeliophyllum distichum TaxID=126358 RepID=A0ABD1PD92_9LAMI
MPLMNMAAKRSRRERPPSSSSSEEEDPQTKRIDRCPILIGMNVDLASFTFDAISFNIENIFIGMGWVPILTLNDKVYPSIVKEFYTKMTFSSGTGASLRHDPHQNLSTFRRSLHDSVALLPKETDTINTFTLKQMKIFKEDGQWVAKSKGFDDESGPSTLPFEGLLLKMSRHLDHVHKGRRPALLGSLRTILTC